LQFPHAQTISCGARHRRRHGSHGSDDRLRQQPIFTRVTAQRVVAERLRHRQTQMFSISLSISNTSKRSFYLRAVTGSGLSATDMGTSPGATTGGAQVNFTDPAIKAYAMEIAADELAHVEFLRKPWARPQWTNQPSI
jgi:hypothetical protein